MPKNGTATKFKNGASKEEILQQADKIWQERQKADRVQYGAFEMHEIDGERVFIVKPSKNRLVLFAPTAAMEYTMRVTKKTVSDI